MQAKFAAKDVSRGSAHGDGQVEHAQDAASFFLWKQIGDKRGCDGDERRFAYTYKRVAD